MSTDNFALTLHVADDAVERCERYGDRIRAYRTNDVVIPHQSDNWYSGYSDMDINILKESSLPKYQKAFANTKIPFNFAVLIGGINDLVFQQKGKDYRQMAVDRYLMENNIEWQPSAHAVNIIMLNNVTKLADYMPLTPWMLVHRADHAILASEPTKDTINPSRRLCGLLRHQIALMVHAFNQNNISLYSHQGKMFFDTDPISLTETTRYAMTCFGTSKSFRDMQFTTDIDVSAELFSQFIIKGKVSLKTWKQYNDAKWQREEYAQLSYSENSFMKYGIETWQRISDQFTSETYTKMVDRLEDELNKHFTDWLPSLVGKTFIF